MTSKCAQAVTILTVGLLIAQGCTWVEEHPKTARGAGIGAAAGGVIGAVTEGRKGAVWGSVIGALAGAAVGGYMDHQDRDADETRDYYDYTGDRLSLEAESFDAAPDTVLAGDTVQLKARYAVLTPQDTPQVAVTETRTILHNGQKVGEANITVQRATGTYTSTIPIELPGSAAAGVYTCTLRLETNGQVSTLRDTFRVQQR